MYTLIRFVVVDAGWNFVSRRWSCAFRASSSRIQTPIRQIDMNRWPIMIVVFALLAAVAHAQQPEGPVITSDLVHWSYIEQPQQPEEKQPGQTPRSGATAEAQPTQIPNAVSSDQPMRPQSLAPTAASQGQTPIENNLVASQK